MGRLVLKFGLCGILSCYRSLACVNILNFFALMLLGLSVSKLVKCIHEVSMSALLEWS